jgi:hypothetical protein
MHRRKSTDSFHFAHATCTILTLLTKCCILAALINHARKYVQLGGAVFKLIGRLLRVNCRAAICLRCLLLQLSVLLPSSLSLFTELKLLKCPHRIG